MLRLYRVLPPRLEYYLAPTVAESAAPYREENGYWLGDSLPPFAYAGEVARAQLAALAVGLDPGTGVPLNAYRSRVRYCAIDATLAAPKSVSVLCVLGADPVAAAVRDAHREAVSATMAFVARRLVVSTRRLPRGRTHLGARPAACAVFEHRTSRAADPHLHSHVLVANLVLAHDGIWSAFEARALYWHVGLVGALYRAQLRHELVGSLGVRFVLGERQQYDIDGFGPELLGAFSRRGAAILADRAARGVLTEPVGRQGAAARAAREDGASFEELRAAWLDRAHRLGCSSSRIERMLGAVTDPGFDRHALCSAIAWARTVPGRPTFGAVLRRAADLAPAGAAIVELESAIDDAVRARALPAPSPPWPFGPRDVASADRGRDLAPRPGTERERSARLVYAR